MRKVIIENKALHKVVKDKEEYYDANYKELHERSLEIEKEHEEIRAKKAPHMKKIAKFAEKAIALLKDNNPLQDEFEEIGQVYVEDDHVVVEVRNAIDEFKEHFLEEKKKAQQLKK